MSKKQKQQQKRCRSKLRITVTDRDIHDGVGGASDWCPVALAFRRAVPDTTLVSVGVSHISWSRTHQHSSYSDAEFSYALPEVAQMFVRAYDLSRAHAHIYAVPAPITFEIHLKDVIRHNK